VRNWGGFGVAGGLALAAAWLAPAEAYVLRWDFAKRPTKVERAAAIPAEIKTKVIEGGASALCEVVDGRLDACKVIDEYPAGAGFGEAAVALAPLYELRPMTPAACNRVFNGALISNGWPQNETDSDWIKKPTARDVERSYPKAALRKGVWGAGAVRCEAPAGGGTLKDCKIIYEEPVGYGFGAAILSLTPLFRISGAVQDGRPAKDDVVIPINFSFPNVC
jgi:hypothetical protein